MRIQLDISIPMRDGVRLYGALYRPDAGERFPVLLIRSPYSTQHPRYVEWARRFVAEGYAVLMQDSRGRYESEDEWRPYVDERDDGYEADQVGLRCSADVRFRGQTSEIGIDLADGPITIDGVARLRADFVREHERLYGHSTAFGFGALCHGDPAGQVRRRCGRGRCLHPQRSF